MENREVETQEVDTTIVAEEISQVEEVKSNKTLDEVLDQTNETMDKVQANLDLMKEIEEREKALFQREVNSSLKDAGLEKFAEVINVKSHEDLTKVIDNLTKIMNEMKIENSYQPKDNAKQDAYSIHSKNKDTKNMIGSKLANLFK